LKEIFEVPFYEINFKQNVPLENLAGALKALKFFNKELPNLNLFKAENK
jgi:hypothetical protein